MNAKCARWSWLRDWSRAATKSKILELYLNSIYLGRGAWGVEMASQSYFGKPATSPGDSGSRATGGPREGARPSTIPNAILPAAATVPPTCSVACTRTATSTRQSLKSGVGQPSGPPCRPMKVCHRARISPTISRARERRSQRPISSAAMPIRCTPPFIRNSRKRPRPLCRRACRVTNETPAASIFRGPKSISRSAVARAATEAAGDQDKPAWQRALEGARLPLYDLHWPAAIVVEEASSRNARTVRVGLADGRVLPLSLGRVPHSKLKTHDVVRVRLIESKGKATRAELRVRPVVQGAVVVLENQSGRILAMTGGFSYPLSQLNRVTQSQRQPGSSLKPLVYLGRAPARPAAQHAGARRFNHLSANRRFKEGSSGRFLDAEKLRRSRGRRSHDPPGARGVKEFAYRPVA